MTPYTIRLRFKANASKETDISFRDHPTVGRLSVYSQDNQMGVSLKIDAKKISRVQAKTSISKLKESWS